MLSLPLARSWPPLVLLAACDGPQSALAPAGKDAERIAELFWWMAGGAAVVWLGVMLLSVYAVRTRRHRDEEERAKMRLIVIGGGALFPTLVLTALLAYGLSMMPSLLDDGDPDGPRIHVSGEQWWWRVTYEMPDGARFELANELHLPVGARTPIRLESPDVIHALWVPSLGGKVDAIPGRVNRMALEPTRTGVFRGVCAEYCGSSHARMMFHVVVSEPDAFESWAAAQDRPARSPVTEAGARGAELFAMHGCGACHAVRGTDADGVIGPDLTHVGSRHAVGAGILPNEVEGFSRWLAHTQQVKPGVHMPTFDMLSDDVRLAIATYLEELE